MPATVHANSIDRRVNKQLLPGTRTIRTFVSGVCSSLPRPGNRFVGLADRAARRTRLGKCRRAQRQRRKQLFFPPFFFSSLLTRGYFFFFSPPAEKKGGGGGGPPHSVIQKYFFHKSLGGRIFSRFLHGVATFFPFAPRPQMLGQVSRGAPNFPRYLPEVMTIREQPETGTTFFFSLFFFFGSFFFLFFFSFFSAFPRAPPFEFFPGPRQ